MAPEDFFSFSDGPLDLSSSRQKPLPWKSLAADWDLSARLTRRLRFGLTPAAAAIFSP
ncbi:hypothetical protein M9458_037017, partial [Cirrhinus mrigala]